ncbi:hypothetical protein [Neobacillus sp. FSL H8-0543]
MSKNNKSVDALKLVALAHGCSEEAARIIVQNILRRGVSNASR